MLFLPALCAASTILPFQEPAPKPTPAPAVAASPEEAAWTAAHELKKKADYEKAGQAFAAYARDFPDTPRGIEALVEDGVCWFSMGRARQRLQQNNQDSLQAFGRATARFQSVVKEHGASPVAGRAQYMLGTVAMFSGDLNLAEREYGNGVERYASDAKYLPKSLERRAAARRHMLKTADARADLSRYVRDFPKGEDVESAKRYLTMLDQFEKPAPELVAEAWVQGDAQKLASLRGDVVVLYFFATWCENCEKARPFLLDLEKRFEAMGVRFIGVVDHSKGQTLESVRAFLGPNGIHFPVLIDNGGMSVAYRGQKIPDVVLLDRLGRVRWHDNPANLQDATLELLLTEDPAAGPAAK
ncbi:MAG: redoxin family protein [Planctomycetota bacterium]|nr:redoxin family protein [Planctomycetota bacterium]